MLKCVKRNEIKNKNIFFFLFECMLSPNYSCDRSLDWLISTLMYFEEVGNGREVGHTHKTGVLDMSLLKNWSLDSWWHVMAGWRVGFRS